MGEIRRQALAHREEIGLPPEEPIPAEFVMQACLNSAGMTRHLLPPDDPALAGAQVFLDLPTKTVALDQTLPPPQQRFHALHAFGHARLHGQSCRCAAADLNPEETTGPTVGARSKVDDGSPQQRRENEANSFAAEILLPGPLARRLFLKEGRSCEAIAHLLGLPDALVQRQLIVSVLLPPPASDPVRARFIAPSSLTPSVTAPSATFDPYQQAAAEIAHGPLLLGAGPGTGKTKTLVGRCQYLTQQAGVPAQQILALTFSRQAAQEMRERLAQAGVGTPDSGPWVGTFHGFGLDILRRFGDRLRLPAEISLLDTLDAVTLLENNLPLLELDALDNLYNPAVHLGGIVKQISRAKDELCPPERYAELCREMQAQAEQTAAEFAARPGKKLKKDEEAVAKALEQAAKAGEVARSYLVYERLMREGGYLDFADLISRTVTLLESHPDVLARLRSEFPHVLADEYQDVNRACAHLVKLLAGNEARGLWAVGDHRQSIYRFRGASPANVAAFHHDYPTGQRLELGVNYRSQTPIVDLFGVAARAMEPNSKEPHPKEPNPAASGDPSVLGKGKDAEWTSLAPPSLTGKGAGGLGFWHAHRGIDTDQTYPAVTIAVAPEEEGQADGIARAIEDLRAAGKPYREQAILCRTHGQAEALAGLLAARDIPALYQGALLERPEVKDLLCLLSLFAGPDGTGLLRVAMLPEYAVPRPEILSLLVGKAFGTTPLPEALQQPDRHEGLRRLGGHLAELETREQDPAILLRHYLFGQSAFLHHLYAHEPKPIRRIQQGMAIHQLLELAAAFDRRTVAPYGQKEGSGNKVRAFLAHLRRLVQSGESLRGAAPPEAETLDAVRVLTAHAAKGLEYPVVFLPNLGAGQFPARGRHDGIPEPPGLTDSAGQETEEEDCLFFVALSRARDHLIISRAETSGADRWVKPSPLLDLIRPWFAANGVGETVWPSGREVLADQDALTALPETLPTYSLSALETYLRCPRQYYYEQELKLAGTFTPGGYPQFHACLRETLRWRDDERAAGREPSDAATNALLEAVWAERGPVGHLHEAKYKDSALRLLRVAASLETAAEGPRDTNAMHATLVHCRVRVRPDLVRLANSDGALVVARHLTGKPGDEDKNDKRLALFRRAASETHPGRTLRLELRYLSTGDILPVEPPATEYKAKLEAERVAKYDAAAQGIGARRFAARRSDECQSCAYALICPL